MSISTCCGLIIRVRFAALGEGDVNPEAWLKRLLELGYRGPLTIKREISGEQQKEDGLLPCWKACAGNSAIEIYKSSARATI